MKKISVLLVMTAIATLFLSSGCGAMTTGSGNLLTETYDFTGFTEVEANVGFEVEIVQSSSFSVEITTDDNIAEFVDLNQSEETLKISIERAGSFSNVTLKARVEMPALAGINFSDGASAGISGFDSTDDFSVTLTRGSRLKGSIDCGDIGFGISGGSDVTLSGSANNLMARSSEGSTMHMRDFSVYDADINIDGGGRAFLDINGRLDTVLTGGSSLSYTGNPEKGEINVSGGSILAKE